LITVEGSLEPNQAGEYVIDLTEYGQSSSGLNTTAHYQLKHSTVRTHEDFDFDNARKTLSGFAARFLEAAKRNDKTISFTLVTNRRVSDKLKGNLQAVRDRGKTSPGFLKSLECATKLKGEKLLTFCSL